ncbi:hypothetical protein [Compostimonas suwonensis]|uniref:Uncharacterized protein n=1 Tax=Compostimonas suwonensis TaxID=1048394 RepID=A0A2M9BZC1_9MICO|nr:hypothetical protein [Compostimonas suwonensis]PJJ63429.1 hypothetical protein CLV54_1094 [Compostimonas suwonensis]
MTTLSEDELAVKAKQLELIGVELDREIGSHIARAGAMEQRATILVGAASVVGALQVTTDLSWTTVVNLALSFLAAVSGVIIVFPRRGRALDMRAVRDGILAMPLHKGEYRLIDEKLDILDKDEHWLTVRGWIARAGFVALALGIVVTLVAALTPA